MAKQVVLGLNTQQQRAAKADAGAVCIVAGPGTGKTKTLVARIGHLVESGCPPERVLALTFTKKAAEEMASRVAGVLSGHNSPTVLAGLRAAGVPQDLPPLAVGRPAITTFHALCHQILGGEQAFVSEPQRLVIIKQLKKSAEFKGVSTRELGFIISRAKNTTEVLSEPIQRLVAGYNQSLAAQNQRDFDDLLLQTYQLLKHDHAARAKLQNRYQHILVDEFQDTNRLQYEIIKLLRGNDNLFIIGDPNQSIYGFRGASGDVFDAFLQDFPAARKITLTTNYRSAPQVVALSNEIFATTSLTAHSQQAGKVEAVEVLNEYSEVTWVIEQIQRAIGGSDLTTASSTDQRANHRPLSDFAILYRNRAVATMLQKLLSESGLPFQVVGDGSPYDKPQIQQILKVLQGQSLSAEEQQVARQLAKLADQSPGKLAEKAISLFGFELNHDLQQLLGTLARFKTTAAALNYFGQIAQTGYYDPAADAITLLTIHASKGLEFAQVFVIGCEAGVLPSKRANPAEEKRLFYVAATRAKHNLTLLHARKRAGQPAKPSPFLNLQSYILTRIRTPLSFLSCLENTSLGVW